MPQEDVHFNDALADVKSYLDLLVVGVRSGVQSGFQLGVSYASAFAQGIYDIYYNLALRGNAAPSSTRRRRDGYAPARVEEGIITPGRSHPDSIPYQHLVVSYQSAQDQQSRQSAAHRPLNHSDAVVRRKQRVATAHNRAFDQRLRSMQQRERLLQSASFLAESVHSIALAIGSLRDGLPSDLAVLLQQFDQDKGVLESHVRLLHDTDTTLIDLDGELQRHSLAFAETVAALNPTSALSRDPVEPASASSTRSNSPVPSLVSRYLDRRGDVLIYQERLYDLDSEHLDEAQEREIAKDRDEQLDITDEAFEEEYQERRAEILRHLASAERDVANLELEGRRRGLDTSLVGRRSSDRDDDAPLEDWEVVPGTKEGLDRWIDQVATQASIVDDVEPLANVDQ